eukprot:gene11245-3292_t
MYGFGDEKTPYSQTVDLMEEMVLIFLRDLTKYALRAQHQTGMSPFDAIMMLIRRDKKKYFRVQELLRSKEAIDEIRQETRTNSRYQLGQ